jgi:hypothetical protein
MAADAPRNGRWRHLLCGLLVVYVAVLCASPLFHHDLDCHLKTPAHCPGCIASPAALRGESTIDLGETHLPPAEAVGHQPAMAAAPLVAHGLKGRSPPA